MPGNNAKIKKMSEKEMRADLESGLADVENRNNALGAQEIMASNKLSSKRETMIRGLMEMVQSMGIDPSDEKAIDNLEEQLRFQNPDLADLFRLALERLLEDKLSGIPEEGIEEEGGELPMEGMEQGMPMPGGPGAPMPMPGSTGDAGIPLPDATNIMGKYQKTFGQ